MTKLNIAAMIQTFLAVDFSSAKPDNRSHIFSSHGNRNEFQFLLSSRICRLFSFMMKVFFLKGIFLRSFVKSLVVIVVTAILILMPYTNSVVHQGVTEVVQAAGFSPVLATHSPYIRQWWQFWGNKETGSGLCTSHEPVYIRFRTDQLGTHVGRLYLEFSGDKKPGSNDHFQVWVATVPYWGQATGKILFPLQDNGKRISGDLSVPGFGTTYEEIYLVVQHVTDHGSDAKGEFRYTGIFVFEESIGGEDIPWTATKEGVRPKNDEKVGFEVFGIPSMNEQETRVAPKIYNMRNPWQKTTSMQAEETTHGWWEWQWGDGEVTYDRDPFNTVGTMDKIFDKVGEYIIKAISYSNAGEIIREKVWHLVLDATSVHLPQSFNFETIGLVNPKIEIIGPRAWITGRPAQYRVKVDYVEPPFGETVITSIKPSENFQMVWDKPGKQTLTVAVAAVTTYKFPKGGQISIRNVYTHSIEVEVATLAISE